MEKEDFDRLRQDLAALTARLEELSGVIKENCKTAHAAEADQQHGPGGRNPVPVVVSYDDQTVKDRKAENERQHRTQESIKNWTKVTVIAAVLYAGFSLLAWCQMVQQNKIANASLRQSIESLRIDRRAWIVIEPFRPTLIRPGVYRYELIPRNVGRTSAYHVALNQVTPIDMGAMENSKEMIANTQDKMLLGKFKGTEGMPIRQENFPTVISPNSTPAAPVFFDFATPPASPRFGRMFQYLIGRIDYEDVFHVRHWLKFCFVVADSEGHLRDCKYGNDEDHNPELPPN